MVYGGGHEACHQDLYDPTGEQDLDFVQIIFIDKLTD